MTTQKTKSVFATLRRINVAPFVKEKPGGRFSPKYIPWHVAWDQVKRVFPEMQKLIHDCEQTGNNYFNDGHTAWVRVSVTIDNQVESTDLPVMRSYKGQGMRSVPVGDITSFDVNNSHQRAMVKCLRLHGFGLDVVEAWDSDYADEPSPPSRKPKKVEHLILLPDSDYWARAMAWAVPQAQKGKGDDEILKELSRKYTIDSTVTELIIETLAVVRDDTEIKQEKSTTSKKLKLLVGDENWEAVVKYATDHKADGIFNIIKALRKKYTVSQGVQLALKKLIS